jgi:putative methyltransferase (TIGR04325 family)
MLRRRVMKYLQRDVAESPARITFAGDYSSWAEAERASVGYDSPIILERTFASLLKIKRGEAAYERDSVLFDTPQYTFPVLVALLRAALAGHGRLSVADVGGSLGSSYFQCRDLLRAADLVEWSVIEQPAYVRRGREHFEDLELRFYDTVEECLAQRQPGVLLLSGVLQYLADPYDSLQRLLAHQLPHVIIDRTAFLASGRDRLTVQSVPDSIYPASYPAWFLSERRVLDGLRAGGYSVAYDFPALDNLSPADEAAYYKGFACDLAPAAGAPADRSAR